MFQILPLCRLTGYQQGPSRPRTQWYHRGLEHHDTKNQVDQEHQGNTGSSCRLRRVKCSKLFHCVVCQGTSKDQNNRVQRTRSTKNTRVPFQLLASSCKMSQSFLLYRLPHIWTFVLAQSPRLDLSFSRASLASRFVRRSLVKSPLMTGRTTMIDDR